MLPSKKLIKTKLLCAVLCFLGLLNVSYAEKENKPLWTSKDAVTYIEANIKDISSDGRYTLLQTYHKSLEGQDVKAFSQCLLVDNKSLKTETLGTLAHSCGSSHFIGDEKQFSYVIEDINGESILYVRDISSWTEKKIQKLDKNLGGYSFAPDGRSFIVTIKEPSERSLRKVEGEERVSKSKFYIQKLDQNFQPTEEVPLILPLELKADNPFSLEEWKWSPDGEKLAFLISSPVWKSGEYKKIYVMDLQTQKINKIIEGMNSLEDIYFSSSGQFIAFVKTEGAGDQTSHIKSSKDIGLHAIHIVNLTTKKEIIIPVEDIVAIAGWTEDDHTLILTKRCSTTVQLYSLDIDTKSLALLKTPHIPCVDGVILSKNKKYIGFNGQSLHQPAEAYIATLDKFSPKKISSLTQESDLRAIQAHPVKWKSFDGVEIEGIIIYPQNYKKGQKVPLIVSLHGGPAGFEYQRFIGGMWFGPYSPAVLASEGYATLAVNYRGSSGYGIKFSELNDQDLGGGDFKDIMAGVDYLIDQGIADSEQLFIRGHSYGGFLTAWAIGHTNRFKAACIGAGIVDWISDISITDAPTYMEGFFGGNYWDNYELWYKTSPLSYVKNMETPTLIIQGLNDGRVPIGQATQLSQALTARKVPVQLLLYSNQGHGIDGILPAKDAIEKTISWFNQHRKNLIKDS